MKNKWRKILVLSLVIVVFLFTVVPFGMGVYAYESSFGGRYETYEPYLLDVSDFDGLMCEDCTFLSQQDAELAGYKFFSSENGDSFSEAAGKAKAVIIIAHGLGGGGFNSYMNVAAWFAGHDYVVFGYDVTGNDNSGGGSVRGLPQAISDLSSAIEYIENDMETANLPIVLWGHSWGAYAVSNVLNEHPEVKAAAVFSGWNTSSDMIYEQGKNMAGEAGMKAILPYMMFYEKIKFEKYSTCKAIDGFKNTKAGILVVHSSDDRTIPIQCGYDLYYEEFSADPRFTFIKYEDRGHNTVFNSDQAREYIDAFNRQFQEDFHITDPKHQKVEPKEKAEYLKAHLDKKQMNEVDEELFEQIDAFYVRCCQS